MPVLAVGNCSDHVHVVFRFPSTVAVAEMAHKLKGVSSRMGKTDFQDAPPLVWQETYWAETCSPRELDALLHYVANQREHHRTGRQIAAFEPEEL